MAHPAYFSYVPARQKSYRRVRIEPGLVVDLGRSGKPIGIEITAPGPDLSFNTQLRASAVWATHGNVC